MRTIIQQLERGESLSREQSYEAFDQLLMGKVTDETIIRFLSALKQKGENTDEICGAAEAMRDAMQLFDAPEHAIDVCGTGGDGLKTYNISTAVAFVVAACGVPVVKHGNKAVSSHSGSSDVLSVLGLAITNDRDVLHRCLERSGFCYLSAPHFHPAMQHVASARRAMQTRTIFNLLGPICNPAGVKRQLVGVYDASLTNVIAQALQQLGSEAAAVVHGHDGLDELSISGPSSVCELSGGALHSYEVCPADAGLPEHPLSTILGGDATENARALLAVLQGERNAYRDAVVMNAAGALIIADIADDPQSAAALATEAIDSGRANHSLQEAIKNLAV